MNSPCESGAGLRSLRFSKVAERDFGDIFKRGLHTRSPERARQYVLDLRDRCHTFAENPDIGRELRNRRRSRYFTFDGLVVIVYAVRDDHILILRALARGRDWKRIVGSGA